MLTADNPVSAGAGDKSRARPFLRWTSRLHRWLAIIVGVQVFLWLLSGAVMAWFTLADVRGESRTSLILPTQLYSQNFIAPGGVIARAPGAIKVTLENLHGKTVYLTEGSEPESNAMFDALTGEKLTPLKEIDARLIAQRDYAGEAVIRHALLLTATPPEYRGPLPVWQVAIDDDWATRLYISPTSGKVISRRNRLWRIFDFFWMLHIMDYDERDDIDNDLLRGFSAVSLLFVVSGILLIGLRLKNGVFLSDFRSIRASRRRAGQTTHTHPRE